jgi:sterol 3beta-glucosyltransferase
MWEPPQELSLFMRDGPPPVYVGFGSVPVRDRHRLVDVAAEALSATGSRGVLAGSGFDKLRLSPSIFTLGHVPHDWLFARVSAVVHHGGAGTTGAGLRAGVPNIIVPFTADHSFWGERVRALGVGPEPTPAKRITVENLKASLELALHDPGMRERAGALGREIRSEDGVSRAVTRIEALGDGVSLPGARAGSSRPT